MKITNYNLSLSSHTQKEFVKKENLKTQISTENTSSKADFTSAQTNQISQTNEQKVNVATSDELYKNIIKFAGEALKNLKKLRKKLGVGDGEVSAMSQMIKDMKNALNPSFTSTKLNYTNNGTYEVLSTTYTLKSEISQKSALELNAQGIIKTSDKELKIDLKFNLANSFVERNFAMSQERYSISLVDPLVINLEGALPSLENSTFSFDIDSDGQMDQISKLKAGNGFLALDSNNNGKIDDGTELFGTQNGDGFAHLGLYDEDKNGFIDENDSIFQGLRIWLNAGDESKLIGLGEAGIGAIFLGSVDSDFSLNDERGDTLGQIAKSGIFLFENGKVGNISHIDLAKKPLYA